MLSEWRQTAYVKERLWDCLDIEVSIHAENPASANTSGEISDAAAQNLHRFRDLSIFLVL